MSKQSNEDKQVFTTGEAAKICNVSQQTIIRCFDNGRLQGFKVPGSRFRRIPRAELLRFMHENNMETSRLGSACLQVLVIGPENDSVDIVIKTYSMGHKVNIAHANNAWSAGFVAHECKPSLILIDPSIEGLDKRAIIASLSGKNGSAPKVISIKNNYQNGVNMQPHEADSKEVIKQAVQQLLTA
jgi:excisionase family DNA binding protein